MDFQNIFHGEDGREEDLSYYQINMVVGQDYKRNKRQRTATFFQRNRKVTDLVDEELKYLQNILSK